jgi:hypothetical protein
MHDLCYAASASAAHVLKQACAHDKLNSIALLDSGVVARREHCLTSTENSGDAVTSTALSLPPPAAAKLCTHLCTKLSTSMAASSNKGTGSGGGGPHACAATCS